MIECKNCRYKGCALCGTDHKIHAATCENYTPATHADRIRSMTDEELARWIDEFWSAAWCPDDPPVDPETNDCLMHDGNCELCILDWLKQEGER